MKLKGEIHLFLIRLAFLLVFLWVLFGLLFGITTMKNKIITGIALCSLFITGCSLDKAYLNGPNASTFPATKSEVEAGVFATYKGLTLIDASSTPFPGIQDNASDIGASRLNAANYN